IEHEFASNADARCEQGRAARHRDARPAQPHLVAETRTWETYQAFDGGASHEPTAANVGAVRTNGEVTAAANLALGQGDLTFEAGSCKPNVAVDVAAAHDPVSANVHGVGVECSAAAFDLDVARVDALLDARTGEHEAAVQPRTGKCNALADDHAIGSHGPVLA